MTQTKNIGIEVPKPEGKADAQDSKCPFTGGLKVRGRSFVGTVVKKDLHRTVTVEWPRRRMVKKYERYEMRRSKVRAHNPEIINAEVGDKVRIVECRKLSKTKNFVVIEKLGENLAHKIKQQVIEEEQKIDVEKKPEEKPTAITEESKDNQNNEEENEGDISKSD